MKKLPNRKSSKWTSDGVRAYIRLMFEHLRLSPSYALATRIRQEKIDPIDQLELVASLYKTSKKREFTQPEKLELLDSFQPVLRTFEEFGDVIAVDFDTWWQQTGQAIYGYKETEVRARSIAQLEQGTTLTPELTEKITEYFNTSRQNDGNPAVVIMAIPLGISKKRQLELVAKRLNDHKAVLPIRAAKSRRPLAAKRLRSEPLLHGISLIWARARKKLPWWKIGALGKVSPTYSSKIDPLTDKPLESNLEIRNTLTILTHRMIKRSQYVAEHAAHGIFPSNKECRLPRFDIAEVRNRLRQCNHTLFPPNRTTAKAGQAPA